MVMVVQNRFSDRNQKWPLKSGTFQRLFNYECLFAVHEYAFSLRECHAHDPSCLGFGNIIFMIPVHSGFSDRNLKLLLSEGNGALGAAVQKQIRRGGKKWPLKLCISFHYNHFEYECLFAVREVPNSLKF